MDGMLQSDRDECEGLVSTEWAYRKSHDCALSPSGTPIGGLKSVTEEYGLLGSGWMFLALCPCWLSYIGYELSFRQ